VYKSYNYKKSNMQMSLSLFLQHFQSRTFIYLFGKSYNVFEQYKHATRACLYCEFYNSEKINNKWGNSKSFETVGGFLFYFLPLKSEEAETFRFLRTRILNFH